RRGGVSSEPLATSTSDARFRSSRHIWRPAEFSRTELGVIMNYESRFLAGILLIVLPTVMIDGVSILSLLRSDLYGEPTAPGSMTRRTRACWRLAHPGACGAALRGRVQSLQCHEMARAGLDSHRRDPGPGSLLPIRAVARCHCPDRAHLSRLCRRSAAGRRSAGPRRRPRQASGTMMLERRVAVCGTLVTGERAGGTGGIDTNHGPAVDSRLFCRNENDGVTPCL